MNSSSYNHYTLEVVKACVHSVMFVVMCVFTYLIKMKEPDYLHLDHEVHYRLLLQHCFCLMGINAVGSVIHTIRSLQFSVKHLICQILFHLKVVMGHGITITITLMCMFMCLSACWPLHYRMLVRSFNRWIILVAWFLAVINPLVYTLVVFAQKPWNSPNSECLIALEGEGFTINTLLLLNIMMLLTFLSYLLICLEGHFSGHFSRSNTKGRLIVLVHLLQTSLYTVTTFIIIFRVQQEPVGEFFTFLIFTISQVLRWTLRCKLLPLFPDCRNQNETQESRVNVEQRESPGTPRRPLVAVISTRTSHCMSSSTDHVSVQESNNDQISEDFVETLV